MITNASGAQMLPAMKTWRELAHEAFTSIMYFHAASSKMNDSFMHKYGRRLRHHLHAVING